MRRATKVLNKSTVKLPDFNPRSPWGERPHAAKVDKIKSTDFNPRSPWGERPNAIIQMFQYPTNFNPRSPWGERHILDWIDTPVFLISIHALREESDKQPRVNQRWWLWFQSTLSVRRATISAIAEQTAETIFQSTLSVRRATKSVSIKDDNGYISIHALREESDQPANSCFKALTDFNPRSPWGERHRFMDCKSLELVISIHALREESDQKPYHKFSI